MTLSRQRQTFIAECILNTIRRFHETLHEELERSHLKKPNFLEFLFLHFIARAMIQKDISGYEVLYYDRDYERPDDACFYIGMKDVEIAIKTADLSSKVIFNPEEPVFYSHFYRDEFAGEDRLSEFPGKYAKFIQNMKNGMWPLCASTEELALRVRSQEVQRIIKTAHLATCDN